MIGVVLFIYALLAYMLEMNYIFIWAGQKVEFNTEKTIPAKSRLLLSNQNLSIALVALLILNIGLLGWVTQQQGEKVETDSSTAQEKIINALDTDNTFVMEVNGIFAFENQPVQQAVISLLPYYNEIIVLSLVSTQSSLVFASDTLPFDQQSLSQVLQDVGETQFIILDTSLLEILATNN